MSRQTAKEKRGWWTAKNISPNTKKRLQIFFQLGKDLGMTDAEARAFAMQKYNARFEQGSISELDVGPQKPHIVEKWTERASDFDRLTRD